MTAPRTQLILPDTGRQPGDRDDGLFDMKVWRPALDPFPPTIELDYVRMLVTRVDADLES